MSDASFSGQLDPCLDPVYGQAEDYTIYLAYNLSPPDADFESNTNYSCDGIVEFSDLSTIYLTPGTGILAMVILQFLKTQLIPTLIMAYMMLL